MQCETWILINSDGDYVVGLTADEARENYTAAIGALEGCDGFRLVCVTVNVPLPEVSTVAVSVTAIAAPK
jgi:FAD/FMN-containing dehydrogenase